MFRLALILLFAISQIASAQEFRPFPQAHVTQEQWQSYFDEIKTKYGSTARRAPNQPLVVFDDGHSTQYAFTQPGHAAHPSWIARKVVEDGKDIYIDQAGFFAGDEAQFASLFRAYRALDANVREYVRSQGERKRE